MAAGPRPQPSTREEDALWASGYVRVAGVDEVGLGPLAGPVFTAAVILDPNKAHGRKRYRWLSEVNDSKVLLEKVAAATLGEGDMLNLDVTAQHYVVWTSGKAKDED